VAESGCCGGGGKKTVPRQVERESENFPILKGMKTQEGGTGIVREVRQFLMQHRKGMVLKGSDALLQKGNRFLKVVEDRPEERS